MQPSKVQNIKTFCDKSAKLKSQIVKFENFSAKNIIEGNVNWVAGGHFIATAPVIMQMVHDYRLATEPFLSNALMNTEQPIIYAMFAEHNFDFKPRVKIKTYKPKEQFNLWFSLGFVCIRCFTYF